MAYIFRQEAYKMVRPILTDKSFPINSDSVAIGHLPNCAKVYIVVDLISIWAHPFILIISACTNCPNLQLKLHVSR